MKFDAAISAVHTAGASGPAAAIARRLAVAGEALASRRGVVLDPQRRGIDRRIHRAPRGRPSTTGCLPRRLSDLGSVGCESAAALHFAPSFRPIVGLWGFKFNDNINSMENHCDARGDLK